jgi:hypothetical protein
MRLLVSLRLLLGSLAEAVLLASLFTTGLASAQTPNARSGSAQTTSVLKPENFEHYAQEFVSQEKEATGKDAPNPWPWMKANIPWFESSDPRFEETYYFRWYSFQKHIVSTPRGPVISEFLQKMPWAGYGNTVGVAVPHQLREARWLRDPSLAESDARFWLSSDAPHRRDYSLALADSIFAVSKASGNNQLSENLLPAMIDDYRDWQKTHQDSNGLYWSIDTRDGMEVSISGDGYRPTLNSYMYADAKAIAEIYSLQGNKDQSAAFEREAAEQRQRIETMLWNPKDHFYEVLSAAANSGIRQHPKFKDPHTTMQLAGVRELIGYVPWYYGIPSADHDVAWKQIDDPQGFDLKFGPPTAERRSPRFRYANDDQCQWNGPTWAYSTTQTLVAMANLLQGSKQQDVDRADYLKLFAKYVSTQQLRLPDGKVIPWTDEAQDAETGDWITRQVLVDRKSPLIGRGAYYDHSGFADPVLTGLVGIEPRADNIVVIDPLLPNGTWSYFAVDGLPYHGHLLTILYDRAGTRYNHGRGLTLLVDGKRAASRPDLGTLRYTLPAGRITVATNSH